MRKIVLTVIAGMVAAASVAQGDPMKDLECKAFNDAVAKNLKNTENAKKSTKSATWLDLGNSYIDLAGRCTDDSTAAEKAESALKKALELENAAGGKKSKEIEAILKGANLSQVFLLQGYAFYGNKNYKKAGAYFEKSSDMTPSDTTATLFSGIVRQINDDTEGSLKYLNLFVEHGGKDPSVFFSIAQAHKVKKDFDKAIATLKKGIEVNPSNKDLQSDLVSTYLHAGKPNDATAYLQGLVDKDPKDVTNMTNLGILYDTRHQELVAEMNKIKKKINDNSTEALDKKLILEQDKLAAYESEIVSLNSKLKKEPKTVAATKKRIAEVTEQKVEIEKEITNLASSIAEKKATGTAENGKLNEKLATIGTEQKGIRDKAVATYEKALALDANNSEALYNMGALYYNEAVEIRKPVDFMDIATYRKEGKAVEQKACAQFAKAQPYFERAASAKPDDELVKESLSNIRQVIEQCNK